MTNTTGNWEIRMGMGKYPRVIVDGFEIPGVFYVDVEQHGNDVAEISLRCTAVSIGRLGGEEPAQP